jgi:hypothetical protein
MMLCSGSPQVPQPQTAAKSKATHSGGQCMVSVWHVSAVLLMIGTSKGGSGHVVTAAKSYGLSECRLPLLATGNCQSFVMSAWRCCMLQQWSRLRQLLFVCFDVH